MPTRATVSKTTLRHAMSLEGLPRLRAASDSAASDSKHRFAVKRGKGDVLVENDRFCKIFHVAICRQDGTPIYDMPARAEPRGAIALAIDAQFRVALLEQWRPVPAGLPSQATYPEPDFRQHGFLSLEVPRGFPECGETSGQAARREAQEELKCTVLSVRPLGWTNFNTSFMLSDIPMFAVLVEPTIGPVDEHEEEGEHIREVTWWTVDALQEKISSGQIRCGVTLACLTHLFASRAVLERLAAERCAPHEVDALLGCTRTFIENVFNELWEIGVDIRPLSMERLCYYAPRVVNASLASQLAACATRLPAVGSSTQGSDTWELNTPVTVGSLHVSLLSFENFEDMLPETGRLSKRLDRLELTTNIDMLEFVKPLGAQKWCNAEKNTVLIHLRTGCVRVRHIAASTF